MSLLLEAIVVGFIMIIIGLIVSKLVTPGFSVELPEGCAHWNDKHIMEITLFATGFLGHLLFEVTGANGWYCKNGNACQT